MIPRHDDRTETPHVPPRETGLDDTIEDTFPASDPPSTIPDPEPPAPPRDDEKPATPPARRWTDARRAS